MAVAVAAVLGNIQQFDGFVYVKRGDLIRRDAVAELTLCR